jgi:hypothetical protein
MPGKRLARAATLITIGGIWRHICGAARSTMADDPLDVEFFTKVVVRID